MTFYNEGFGIKLHMKVDIPLYKERKSNQETFKPTLEYVASVNLFI